MIRFTVGLLARVPAYAAGVVFGMRYGGRSWQSDGATVLHRTDRPQPPPEPLVPLTPRLHLATCTCPCCGYTTLSSQGMYEICILCWWEDEDLAADQGDDMSAANRMTLTAARHLWREEIASYQPGPWQTGAEWEARKAIVVAFDAMKERAEGEREELWTKVARAEQVLLDALDRQRAEGAERAAKLRLPRIPIGHWHDNPTERSLPHPQALVDWNWEPLRRWRMIHYLRGGRIETEWRGWSYCRVGCWRLHLGTADLTDGVWVWPEGLAHYVAFHGIRLPDEFVAYAAASGFRAPEEVRLDLVPRNWETFWEEWSRQHAEFRYEPNCLACAESRGEVGPEFFSLWRRVGQRMLRSRGGRRPP